MEKQDKESNLDQTEEIIVEDQQNHAISNDETKIDYAAQIQVLEEKIDQFQDKLLRQLAETENIRTRSAKRIEEEKDYAIFGFSRDLVPVMDNLSRTLEHLPQHLDADTKNIVEGIKMTKKELAHAFKKHALELIQPHLGDKFDYHSHHAISQIMTDDQEPGTIVTTMQVGYRIKDRLIRPAAVSVAKKPHSVKENLDE
jgi:molecular chaperone GrpE